MSVKELFDITGKAALITGGSRGLGLQMAEALGEMGARVAITARKPAELDAAADHLKNLGVEVAPVTNDLSKFDTIPGLVNQVVEALGGVATTRPAGRLSVKARAVAAAVLPLLSMLKLRVLAWAMATGLGAKLLAKPGGGLTRRVSLAVPLSPRDEARLEVFG